MLIASDPKISVDYLAMTGLPERRVRLPFNFCQTMNEVYNTPPSVTDVMHF